ncbi:hypothetical protein [Cellulomonas sp. P5_E12]
MSQTTPTPPQKARRSPQLDVHVESSDQQSTLHVTGCVDLSTADDLARAITEAMLRTAEGGNVTVDLRGGVRVGPEAADVLSTALRQSVAHGVTLTIVGGGVNGGQAHGASAAVRDSAAARS